MRAMIVSLHDFGVSTAPHDNDRTCLKPDLIADRLPCSSSLLLFSFHQVIHQLTEKCKQMQAELEEYARAQEEHQQLQKDHVVLLAEMHALRSDVSIQISKILQSSCFVHQGSTILVLVNRSVCWFCSLSFSDCSLSSQCNLLINALEKPKPAGLRPCT